MANFQVLRQDFSSEINPLSEDALDLIFGGKKIRKCKEGYDITYSVEIDDKGKEVKKEIITCGCGYLCYDDGTPDDELIDKPIKPLDPIMP